MVAQALPEEDRFELEGHVLPAVEVGHTDTIDSIVLWVPDLKLAVCGDVVYGDVHQYLIEANTREKRMAWIAALQKVKAVGPETVVAGHRRPGGLDGGLRPGRVDTIYSGLPRYDRPQSERCQRLLMKR